MGGEIWVESALGQGSRFHFTACFELAKRTGEQAAVSPEAIPLDEWAALVVDDNATIRRILCETLARWGMRTAAAAEADQALAMLRAAYASGTPFHLLIDDAHMPGKSGFTLVESVREHPESLGTAIVMLTSGGQREDAARCRDLKVAHLSKPVRQSELRTAVMSALNLTAPSPQQLIARHQQREERSSLAILVAEDNVINQRVIVSMLERRGHSVALAATGREALELLEKRHFDIVLMDVQMPEMDGLEATRAIRGREKITGGHQVIIATTAHAIKGDAERCLEAGMDAYASKPIHAAELLAAIHSLAPAGELTAP
jgi:CheY-like chemotaxis protein